MPHRVVLDTNIYVSALAFPGGQADRTVFAANEGRYILLTSAAILAELATTLTRKFSWEPSRALDACTILSEIATVIKPVGRIRVLSDEPDNRILECAVSGQASHIVTGDKVMLKHKQHETIPIVSLSAVTSLLDTLS